MHLCVHVKEWLENRMILCVLFTPCWHFIAFSCIRWMWGLFFWKTKGPKTQSSRRIPSMIISSPDKLFLMRKEHNFSPLLSPFIFMCLSISPLLPNHINSCCPSLLNIHSHYFSHTCTIFISFTSITPPFFSTTVSPSFLFPRPPPRPYTLSCNLSFSSTLSLPCLCLPLRCQITV